MGRSHKRVTACLAAAAFHAALTSAATAEIPKYQILDLGALGGDRSRGVEINNAGEVTGVADGRAFLYRDGVMLDLGALGPGNSEGSAINESGHVAGNGQFGRLGGKSTAFLYAEGQVLDIGDSDFATPSEDIRLSIATDISDLDHLVGIYLTEDDLERSFLYTQAATIDLGGFGGTRTTALAVNNAGQATGWASYAGATIFDEVIHAFLWSDGALIDLDAAAGGARASFGIAMNDKAEVTGWTREACCLATRAFVYRNGAMIDLGTLGGEESMARDINEAGQITGTSWKAGDAGFGAFLYSDGLMTDISGATLGSEGLAINNRGDVAGFAIWLPEEGQRGFVYKDGELIKLEIDAAVDINDFGQVTGQSLSHTDEFHAILATPISLLFERLLEDAETAALPARTLARLQLASSLYAAEKLRPTCGQLHAFIGQVRSTPQPAATTFIQKATDIETALGC